MICAVQRPSSVKRTKASCGVSESAVRRGSVDHVPNYACRRERTLTAERGWRLFGWMDRQGNRDASCRTPATRCAPPFLHANIYTMLRAPRRHTRRREVQVW